MSVGYSVGKGDLDLALGVIATGTRDMLSQALQVVAILSTLTDQQLGNLGYSPSDVTLVRSVQSDINQLAQIIQGQATLATTHNFLTSLQQLYGTH